MKTWAAAAVVVAVLGGLAAGQRCEAYDPEHHNGPICNLPLMHTHSAADGYVSATGQWTPSDLFPAESESEIECVRANVPQLSNSQLGFCQIITAFLTPYSRGLGIATNDYDIVSWGKSRIIAERSKVWQIINCEQQQLVFDFPSNTVTITSTSSFVGRHCADMNKEVKEHSKVFTLIRYPFELFPSKYLNPFLKVAQ
jgi:hypothetical protein